MTKAKKEFTIFECKEIISTWKYNISEKNISEALNHPQSTIYNVISTYKNSEYEVLSPRTGRPKLIIKRDSHHLVKILKKDRKVNL